MAASDHIDAVRRLEQAYNDRDYDTVRSVVAGDFVAHTPGSEMMPPGVEGAIAANEGGWQSFPDKRSEILEVFGQGDRVVSHVRMTGTNNPRGIPRRVARAKGRLEEGRAGQAPGSSYSQSQRQRTLHLSAHRHW